ncbi:MAG: flavodoxin family protein [Lachnospiraceae bacterium]|nr:flavodoxin family protein [Lachnospiraceae bacterium]
MKVLLINGSPNEKGCTYTALEAVAAEIEKQEIETEIFWIGKQPVRGCIGCKGCAGKPNCVFDDDITNRVLAKAEEADGYIIGSPVYFASPNGTLMALLDRIFYAGKCFSRKPAAAVVSARRAGTTASLDAINKYFLIRNMPIVSSRYWNMVHGNTPEEVKQDLEGMQTMRVLGKNMVWLLKSLEAGKQAGVLMPEEETPVRTNFIR